MDEINTSQTSDGYTVKTYSDGTEAWFKDDKLHCEDGPAITKSNGKKVDPLVVLVS